ncbi:unnamed protein product, partial [Schistosoma curassoni]|uniref:GRIP domain-containing protein n=1 Tax=Schistosoma curassoni TaxID=6186 RepID=A0A183KGK8_9TREM
RNLEDLQFRIEEENIDKSTTESQNADDESKIFELEEALMSARETNERMELELNKLRVELNDLLQKQTNVSNQSDENKSQIQASELNIGSCFFVGKPSLQFTGLVSETSITPTENEGESFQNECERLRNLLAERQAEAEIMLKHQAETIESLTVEFNGQVEKLNCQLQNSSNEIQAFKNENNLLKQQNNELVLSLKSQIDQLNKQLTEQEKIANEKLSMFENRIKELNNVLSAAESFHSVQIEEVNNLQLINKINNDDVDTVTNQETIQLLLEKLKVQEELFNEQKEQLLNIQLQTIALNQDKVNSNNKLNEVENYLNKLKIELNESRIKQEELLTELNSAHLKRDQLVEDISKVLGDLSLTGNAENLSTILCNRINDLKEQM